MFFLVSSKFLAMRNIALYSVISYENSKRIWPHFAWNASILLYTSRNHGRHVLCNFEGADNHEKIKDVLYSVSEIMLSNEKLVKTWISDLLWLNETRH